jgi:hypothetical protein
MSVWKKDTSFAQLFFYNFEYFLTRSLDMLNVDDIGRLKWS